MFLDAAAQFAADHGPVEVRQRSHALRELLRRVAVEAQLRPEQVVEDRVRGEHGQTTRRRLVDDLVGRTGAHVVDERIGLREQPGNLGVRHCVFQPHPLSQAELSAEPLELGAVCSLSVRQRGSVDGQ